MYCFGNSRLWTIGVTSALTLTACSEFYPRFDSILNPEIRSLRSVEVVDAVRCAVSEFLNERYWEIIAEAGARTEKFCPGSGKSWQFRAMHRPKENGKISEKCKPSNTAGDADPVNCSPAYHIWKYVRYQPKEGRKLPTRPEKDGSNPTYWKNCVPNGGCVPGTIPKGNNACALDDDSRFALDANSNASIELTLTANNQGFMNYTRIDREQLGWLKNFIAGGNDPPGTPFPSLQIKSKAQNVASMKIVMPQSRWIEEAEQSKAVKDLETTAKVAMKQKAELEFNEDRELRRLLKRYLEEQLSEEEKKNLRTKLFLEKDSPERGLQEPERSVYTAQALKALQNEQNAGFERECGRRDVDFAGLRRLLKKFVVEREQELFEGAPEVSLDEMVLTTSFQIVLDASAGTYHIFRFFPLLVPPTLNINPDHTNQLKITFKGVKGRANPRNREALRQKCLTRLQGVIGASSECNTPNSLLLESLIEAVESSKSGG